MKWREPEQAFEAWKQCSKGRPCDYSGLSYERLRGGSGIQWPCTNGAPEGTERLYHAAHSLADECEQHASKLDPFAARYGADIDQDGAGGPASGLLESVRRQGIGAPRVDSPGRRPPASRPAQALSLGHGGRHPLGHRTPGAQAVRDRELVTLVRECHTDTELQSKRLLTRIKVAAPQILMS